MNALLKNIAEKASEDLRDLIESGSEDILTAIHKMEVEAQLQETAPKFNLAFKIAVDFDKATFACDLSWTLKQSLSTEHKIEDPNQPNLDLREAASDFVNTVRQGGGGSIDITIAGKTTHIN